MSSNETEVAARRTALDGGRSFRGYSAGDAAARRLAGVDGARAGSPVKIVCVGLNYKDHAAEVQEGAARRAAALPEAVDGRARSGRAIKLPPGVGRVDYEAELAVGHRPPGAPRAAARARGTTSSA